MKRGVIFFSALILAFVFFAAFVQAAGDSTVDPTETDGADDSAIDPTDLENTDDSSGTQASAVCADRENLRDRIKCRLDNRQDVDPYNARARARAAAAGNSDRAISIPEACRNLGVDNKERCRTFYTKVRHCYDLAASEKDRCFRSQTGIDKLREASQEKVRDYLVSLLYELQERIEKLSENDRIDSDDAAEAIALIVEIKEDLLTGEGKETVKPMLQDLREKIREMRSGASSDE